MHNDLLESFITKADAYLSTANSNSITYHDTYVNELLEIASKIQSNIISLYDNVSLNDNHKLVVLHILDRLEYKWRDTRKGIPYSVAELKKVFLHALKNKNESLRFQAVKCSSIAESISREYTDFGDTFFAELCELLKDDSARIRGNTLFLLCCNAPDSKTRSLPDIKPLKKILSEGNDGEIFQGLQYLRGRKEIYIELKPELSKRLNDYDGSSELQFPEVFVKYLTKNEILDFVEKLIQYNTITSLSSLLSLLNLETYPEIKEICKNHLPEWYENFPVLRTRIAETSTKMEIPLQSFNSNQLNELPESEFLVIVSNKRVDGTLPRIAKIFSMNQVMIFRGDGGFDILSALSFYTREEVLKLKGSVSESVLSDMLSYCSE